MTHLMPYIILFGLIIGLSLIVGFIRWRRERPKPFTIPIMEYGKQIRVTIDACEIRSRDYFESSVMDTIPSRMDMLDSLYGGPNDEKKIKKVVSVITYKYKDETGQTIEYRSEPIYASEDTIRYSFLNSKRDLIIYVDPNNKNNYYFDVNF